MTAAEWIVLGLFAAAFALAVRHAVRRGPCAGCRGACAGCKGGAGCASCKARGACNLDFTRAKC